MSVVWEFCKRLEQPEGYKEGDDDSWKMKAQCTLCPPGQGTFSLGSKERSKQTTKVLLNHITSKHELEYDDAIKKRAKASTSSHSVQSSLQDPSTWQRKWNINLPSATNVHKSVLELIALDFQPVSIVEDDDF